MKPRIGDTVIIPGTAYFWKIVPADPADPVDVVMSDGVTIKDGFYWCASGRIISLRQDSTGDKHEVMEADIKPKRTWEVR